LLIGTPDGGFVKAAIFHCPDSTAAADGWPRAEQGVIHHPAMFGQLIDDGIQLGWCDAVLDSLAHSPLEAAVLPQRFSGGMIFVSNGRLPCRDALPAIPAPAENDRQAHPDG
jgi:hypothetical protein